MGAVELGAGHGHVLCAARRGAPRGAHRDRRRRGAGPVGVRAGSSRVSPHGLGETLAGMARSYPHTPVDGAAGPGLVEALGDGAAEHVLRAAAAGERRLRAAPSCARAGRRALPPAVRGGGGAAGRRASTTARSRTSRCATTTRWLLAPLFFGVIVAWVALSPPGRAAAWARAAATACVAATTAGFLGHARHLPLVPAPRPGARRRARGLVARCRCARTTRCAMIGNLWALARGLRPAGDHAGDRARRRRDARPVLLLGQRPEHRGRCAGPGRLRAACATRSTPRWPGDGWRRYFVREDYSFAVYVPERAAMTARC